MEKQDTDLKNFFATGIAILLIISGLWMMFGLADHQEKLNPLLVKFLGLSITLFFSIIILLRVRRLHR